MKNETYIIVRHKMSGRAFSMARDYSVLENDLGIIDEPKDSIEDWDGWLPSYEWQRPDWVNQLGHPDYTTHLFKAWWLF